MVRDLYEPSCTEVERETEMNSFIELANYLENGLNAALAAALGNENIEFKIWANSGQHTPPVRSGNIVKYFIDGNLRSPNISK